MTLSSISTPLTENHDVLRDYLDSQRLRGRRMSTISAYEQFLVRFLCEVGKPVTAITTKDCRRFLMAEERRGNQPATLASKVSKLSTFFGWLQRERIIRENPMDLLSMLLESRSHHPNI